MKGVVRLLFAWVAVLTAAGALAAIEIEVDAKDGDVISGERTFRAIVQSENLVTSVEFYVNGDLRDTDDSTPYEFVVDTVTEEEGAFEIAFAAYTREGESARKSVKLTIDNQLGQGADFHVERGNDLVAEGKWDEAISAARVALKIQEGYAPARIVLAKANFGKKVYDAAQNFAQLVLDGDPNNVQALEVLAAVNLQKAFTLPGTGDRDRTLNSLAELIKAAAEARVRLNDVLLAEFDTVTDANRNAFLRTALETGRYSLVIDQLTPLVRQDERDTRLANLLAYAQMRAGRFQNAAQTLANLRRRGQPDRVTEMLQAVLLQQVGDTTQAQAAEAKAIGGAEPSGALTSGRAYLAILRRDIPASLRLAGELREQVGSVAAVDYFLSVAEFARGEYETSRQRFEAAVLADPSLHDLYIERGNQAIFLSQQSGQAETEVTFQRRVARAYFAAALAAKPESFEAFTGIAIVDLMDGKLEESVANGRLATTTGREYAAGYYALAGGLAQLQAQAARQQAAAEGQLETARQGGNRAEVDRLTQAAAALRRRAVDLLNETDAALKRAGELDTVTLLGRGAPQAVQAWRYFSSNGRVPLLDLSELLAGE